MPCFKPTTIRIKNDLGREYDQKINCKNCIGCLTDNERMWTDRIVDEASLYDNNLFVTLSYDEEHLPDHESVNIRDGQLFMKKLRKKFPGFKIRFLYKAEYGENTARAHYHYALFNTPKLTDMEYNRSNDNGDKLYTSKTIEDIWGNGFVLIGELNRTTAGYIARYIVKSDQKTKSKRDDFEIIDPDGVVHHRNRKPFLNMSRRPGIGRAWLEKNFSDVFPRDEYFVQAKAIKPTKFNPHPLRANASVIMHKPPAYYFRCLEQMKPEMHAELKLQREDETLKPKNKWNRTKKRLTVRETCLKAKLGRDSKIDNTDL